MQAQSRFEFLEKRPLAFAGLFLCLGSLCAESISFLSTEIWIGILLVLTILSLLHRGSVVLCLCLAFFALAVFQRQATLQQQASPELNSLLIKKDCLIQARGRIEEKRIDLENKKEGFYLFSLESLRTDSENLEIPGKLWLSIAEDDGRCEIGDRIELLGKLRPIPKPSNFHERNRQAFSYERRIYGRLWTSAANIKIFDRRTLEPQRWIHKVRNFLLTRLQTRFSKEAVQTAAPLLLGIWPSQRNEIAELYSRTGTIHLLAISGMHVVLLFGLVFTFLSKSSLPRWSLLVFFLPLVLGYSLLAGSQTPVWRATLMFALYSCALFCRRRPDAATILGTSALFLIFLEPYEISSISFQLSFAAVWGMLLFSGPLEKRMPIHSDSERLHRWILSPIVLSLGAFLGSVALIAHHFGTLTFWAIPATLILSPFLPLLLFLGYFALLAPEIGSQIFVSCFEQINLLVNFLLRSIDRLPGTPLFAPQIPALAIALFCIAILLWLKRKALWTWIACLILGIGMWAISNPKKDCLQLDLFDVGHGNAILLRLPNQDSFFFDTGSLDRPDLARSILFPFLQKEKIPRIDFFFLSHSDSDHRNALPELLTRLPIQQFVANAESLHFLPKQIAFSVEGKFEFQKGDVTLCILQPSLSPGASGNDRSLSLRVNYAGRTIWLFGDLEEEGTAALCDSGENLNGDILLLPHHGLRNEWMPELLDSVSPVWILVSSGNRFQSGEIPASEQAKVLGTREQGQIHIEIDADGLISVSSFRSGKIQ